MSTKKKSLKEITFDCSMKTKIGTLLLGICLSLLTYACKSKEMYKKEIEVIPGKAFYKVLINHNETALSFHVKARTVNDELFDFNVIDSLSYDSYKISQNPNDLIFFYKIRDIKNLDTNIQIPKGKSMLGFENAINDRSIQFTIEITTLNRVVFPW